MTLFAFKAQLLREGMSTLTPLFLNLTTENKIYIRVKKKYSA